MHGTNKARGFDKESHYGARLQVHKIWYTIQGEGPFSGMPAVFIRLTGCNLRCTFCDTEWDDENDLRMTIDEILEVVVRSAPHWSKLVVLTGGEPTRQRLEKLIPALTKKGFHVQIETAGSFWQNCFDDPNVTIIVSPKVEKIHPKIREHAKAFKYVIQADSIDLDGLPNQSTQVDSKGGAPARPPKGAVVYLQPCDVPDDLQRQRNLRAVARIAMTCGHIEGLQMHKIWGVD